MVGTEIFEIIGCIRKPFVAFLTEVEIVIQREPSVFGILHIKHWQAVLSRSLGQVFIKIDETRLDRGCFRIDYFGYKCALHVAVSRDSGNLRLVYLLDRSVVSDAFVHGYVVVAEMTVGKVYYLLFGYLRDAVHAVCHIAPFLTVDEGIDKYVGTSFVAFKGGVISQFLVVDYRFEQIFVEVSFLQFVYFFEKQGLYIIE